MRVGRADRADDDVVIRRDALGVDVAEPLR